MSYSEENINNKNLKFMALPRDGFGSKMIALLNAMYCSKKFNLPFGFTWCQNKDITENQANVNKLIKVTFGQSEEVFSSDFIENYLLPEELAYQYDGITGNNLNLLFFRSYKKIKNFSFHNLLYYKPETPQGWVMPSFPLYTIFNEIDKEEYREIVKECWNEIGLSKEFCEIIKKVDTAVENKGNFISVHVRSGDIVYKEPAYSFVFKAMCAELAVEIIIRELPHNNIVLLGEDVDSLEKIIDYSFQTLKEKKINCNGHSIILSKDLIENNIYEGIHLAFYDSYVLSKGVKIYSSATSYFLLFASIISSTADSISCYEYFSEESQFEIIKEYIGKIKLHPAQQAFSYLHLLILAKKLGKSFEEQLEYAQKMLSLYDNNRYKLKYGYFLFENKRFDLFYDYFKSLSLGEIIVMVCHSLCPGFEQAVIGRDLENFLFAILTTNVVRKKRNFATLKRELPDFYKPLFYHIYKKPLFRLRVHYYHLFHKKLH